MPLLSRDDCVLLVVDAQPAFFAGDALTADAREHAAQALRCATWVAGMAADLEIPRVVVEEGPERAGATDAALLEAAGPDVVVTAKRTFSAARSSETVDALHRTRRGTVVLVGFETDTCIAQSAIELGESGLRAVVVEDCCASTSPRAHDRGLARLRQAGVEVYDAKATLFEWLPVVDDALSAVAAARGRLGARPFAL